eukprot:COSAG02_NODE_5749_length_4068_cov_14.293525_2_plen_201_part_00
MNELAVGVSYGVCRTPESKPEPNKHKIGRSFSLQVDFTAIDMHSLWRRRPFCLPHITCHEHTCDDSSDWKVSRTARTRIDSHSMASDLMMNWLLHPLHLHGILLVHGSRPQAHPNGLHLEFRVQLPRLGSFSTSQCSRHEHNKPDSHQHAAMQQRNARASAAVSCCQRHPSGQLIKRERTQRPSRSHPTVLAPVGGQRPC